MGMSDTVVVLDGAPGLSCPVGHAVRAFRTKDFDHPSMATYLVQGGRLFRTLNDERTAECDDTVGWRLQGDLAFREHRYSVREVHPPRTVRVYGQCVECDPVLVRCDHATFLGDFVQEHALFVDFRLTFRAGEPVQVERASGTRADLQADLRARGLYVLEDQEPLALVHREIERVRWNSRDARRGGS